MANTPSHKVNENFFKKWNRDMAYILGFFVADGCIGVSKDRVKNYFTFNITSVDKKHLEQIKKKLKSTYKISEKPNSSGGIAYQLQIRNMVLAQDLIALGVKPRKTHTLGPIKIPPQYFADFCRGFFDGDGTVYVYDVNKTPQIKIKFVCSSKSFLTEFNKNLCENLQIATKTINEQKGRDGGRKMSLHTIDFYVDDCKKLYNFMYRNNPSLYLQRKKNVFDTWMSKKRRGYTKRNYPSKVGWNLTKGVKPSKEIPA